MDGWTWEFGKSGVWQLDYHSLLPWSGEERETLYGQDSICYPSKSEGPSLNMMLSVMLTKKLPLPDLSIKFDT